MRTARHAGEIGEPRATGRFIDQRDNRYGSTTRDAVHHLADRGVQLIGVDTPSVDPYPGDNLPSHQACLARGVIILEGLALADVPQGTYELIALPLKLRGFDASPVRAILRTL